MTLNKQILHIALPAIVSNITVPLLGLVDVAIVGHLGAAAYIGAIAIGGMTFNVIYWVFAFLRMGTSGLTSQALGARNFPETLRLLLRSIAISLFVALLLIVLQVPILEAALLIMQPSEHVGRLTAAYFNILIWGAPAMLMLFSLSGWFIGMQDSKTPMFVAIAQNIINIAASTLLVFGFHMKVEGVAYGTLIAQYGGLLMALALGAKNYHGRLRHHFTLEGLWDARAMKRFFTVNRDIFLRTLCLVSVMLFFTSAGSWQGDVVLAVNTLLMQFYLLFSYIMDGFAYAGEALSGKAYGANDRNTLRATVRHLFAWGAWMSICFTFVYLFGGDTFLSLLTNEPSVVLAAHDYWYWALIMPAAGVAAFIWDGVFIGCTATRGMLLSMFFAALTFFSIFFTLRSELGNHALWLAFIAFLMVRGLVQTLLYLRESGKFPPMKKAG